MSAKRSRMDSGPVRLIITGTKVFLSDEGDLCPAALLIGVSGTILEIRVGHSEVQRTLDEYSGKAGSVRIDQFGDDRVILPGVVDSHVHCNDPGRTAWEGFTTATQAASRGGVTTVCDMPLNSLPPTTTVKNLDTKREEAKSQAWTDLCFWGGFVDDNTADLRPLVEAGVRGFKCFMIHSGVDEFRFVSPEQIRGALVQLRGTGRPLLFHAEMDVCGDGHKCDGDAAAAASAAAAAAAAADNDDGDDDGAKQEESDPAEYATFLHSRPPSMENKAIREVIAACRESNVPCHVVHLSAAAALPMIREAKKDGVPLTVETCFHYLHFEAEAIPRGEPRFKCCPPIRESANREELWKALADGTIDMVVSDHSPCTADLKAMPDYMKAWGGISSVQFGLSVMNTARTERGLAWGDIVRWLCEAPAALIGFGDRKGRLATGYDADIVVFDPEAPLDVTKDGMVFKNKLSAYEGLRLRGQAVRTYLGGQTVWADGELVCQSPPGVLL